MIEDKRNRFADKIFTYKILKDNKIIFYYENRQVMTIKHDKALSFINKIKGKTEREIQLIIAKLTGNFKRGNER